VRSPKKLRSLGEDSREPAIWEEEQGEVNVITGHIKRKTERQDSPLNEKKLQGGEKNLPEGKGGNCADPTRENKQDDNQNSREGRCRRQQREGGASHWRRKQKGTS